MDDDKNFLVSLKDALEKYEGFEVLTATTGSEAEKILREEPAVDLIISDLKMGEIDGLQLLTYVSREFPSLPFILMTAYGSPAIKKKVQELGAGYLEKPLTLKTLTNAINTVLKKEESPEGIIKNFSAISLAQLIRLEGKSCDVLIISERGEEGILGFLSGELTYARAGTLEGDEAAKEIFKWKGTKLFIKEFQPHPKNIHRSLESLILEAAREKDEGKNSGLNHKEKNKKEVTMPLPYEEIVESFKEIPGYVGSAIFNVNGEQLVFHALKDADRLKKYFLQMTSLFVAGQKAAEKTGAGGLDFIQTDSDLGKFLARRGEKFIAMLMLEEDGNIALAKEALEEAAKKI